MRGQDIKTLVVLALALLLTNLPCLAVCLTCAVHPSAPPCHHQKTSHRDDGQNSCPHQSIRAMVPSSRPAHAITLSCAGSKQACSGMDTPYLPHISFEPLTGLSPPDSLANRLVVLRV
ncbi:MAG TPA: hypothetical protein VMH81_38815 [Bryobacteraceae bacterium]|nr:hypothetical protein [Bryobacteraceae bacterium]